LDFGDFGFWILDFGDFGFWILGVLDFGFWLLGILDFGFWSPKSKKPQNPKSNIPQETPKFGVLGASRKELLHNDPKSKIPNPQNPNFGDFGFWILDSGDFGF